MLHSTVVTEKRQLLKFPPHHDNVRRTMINYFYWLIRLRCANTSTYSWNSILSCCRSKYGSITFLFRNGILFLNSTNTACRYVIVAHFFDMTDSIEIKGDVPTGSVVHAIKSGRDNDKWCESFDPYPGVYIYTLIDESNIGYCDFKGRQFVDRFA